jgi:hypothetical protein
MRKPNYISTPILSVSPTHDAGLAEAGASNSSLPLHIG